MNNYLRKSTLKLQKILQICFRIFVKIIHFLNGTIDFVVTAFDWTLLYPCNKLKYVYKIVSSLKTCLLSHSKMKLKASCYTTFTHLYFDCIALFLQDNWTSHWTLDDAKLLALKHNTRKKMQVEIAASGNIF